jgi:hypothetical protein
MPLDSNLLYGEQHQPNKDNSKNKQARLTKTQPPSKKPRYWHNRILLNSSA